MNYTTTTTGQRISEHSNTPESVGRTIHHISGYSVKWDENSVSVAHPPEDRDWVVQLLALGGYTC